MVHLRFFLCDFWFQYIHQWLTVRQEAAAAHGRHGVVGGTNQGGSCLEHLAIRGVWMIGHCLASCSPCHFITGAAVPDLKLPCSHHCDSCEE